MNKEPSYGAPVSERGNEWDALSEVRGSGANATSAINVDEVSGGMMHMYGNVAHPANAMNIVDAVNHADDVHNGAVEIDKNDDVGNLQNGSVDKKRESRNYSEWKLTNLSQMAEVLKAGGPNISDEESERHVGIMCEIVNRAREANREFYDDSVKKMTIAKLYLNEKKMSGGFVPVELSSLEGLIKTRKQDLSTVFECCMGQNAYASTAKEAPNGLILPAYCFKEQQMQRMRPFADGRQINMYEMIMERSRRFDELYKKLIPEEFEDSYRYDEPDYDAMKDRAKGGEPIGATGNSVGLLKLDDKVNHIELKSLSYAMKYERGAEELTQREIERLNKSIENIQKMIKRCDTFDYDGYALNETKRRFGKSMFMSRLFGIGRIDNKRKDVYRNTAEKYKAARPALQKILDDLKPTLTDLENSLSLTDGRIRRIRKRIDEV